MQSKYAWMETERPIDRGRRVSAAASIVRTDHVGEESHTCGFNKRVR
jgi:hypothetical protein